MPIRTVGFFQELESRSKQKLPSVRELAGKLDIGFVNAVLTHLRDGEVFLDVMGVQVDPIDGRTPMPDGMSLVTDGEWVWRNDLSYLVEKHHVGLPPDFLAHVLAARKLTPAKRVELVERWRDFDLAYREAIYPASRL